VEAVNNAGQKKTGLPLRGPANNQRLAEGCW